MADRPALNYVVIVGKGRSGTTWLANILATYPHCCYKHEPFPDAKPGPYNQWRRDLITGDAQELRQRFDAISRSCIHGIDQPPFPPHKTVRPQNPRTLRLLHSLGNCAPGLQRLYERFGRPVLPDGSAVLIKVVNFPNELLNRFCEVVKPKLLPIVRNPFANIASHLSGIRLGLFENDRARDEVRVRELIDAPGGEAYAQYRDELPHMSVAAFEALRWRLQVEPLVAKTRACPRSKLVVYEDLCADPHRCTSDVFDFVGWTLGPETRDFIDASISGERAQRDARRAFYSVYRDPRASMSKWKTQLSADQQADIAAIMHDSPLRDLWTDLPSCEDFELQPTARPASRNVSVPLS